MNNQQILKERISNALLLTEFHEDRDKIAEILKSVDYSNSHSLARVLACKEENSGESKFKPIPAPELDNLIKWVQETLNSIVDTYRARKVDNLIYFLGVLLLQAELLNIAFGVEDILSDTLISIYRNQSNLKFHEKIDIAIREINANRTGTNRQTLH